MTTILTKKKDTTGAPAPGDLTNAAGGAELAVNTFDKRLYTKDSGGTVVEIGTNPTILNVDNIQIDGSTISSTNTNGNINITPNGTGSVVVSKLQVTGTFQLDGNVTIGDSSADTLTINSTVLPGVVISGSSSGDALLITQTGSGNALVVEDSTNPDSTPFVVDASGNTVVGYTSPIAPLGLSASQLSVFGTTSAAGSTVGRYSADANPPEIRAFKSRSTTIGSYSTVSSGDSLGRVNFFGDDGTAFVRAAAIDAAVDGTPGTNDMPGRLVFSTTADGASTPTERMRIDSAGGVGIGSTSLTGYTLRLGKNITGTVSPVAVRVDGVIQTDVTNTPVMFQSRPTTAASTSLSNLYHYSADPQAFGAGTAVVDQIGFYALGSLTGATNNYGFFSNIAAGTGRWNFYANGTAANYFAGNVQFAAGTAAAPALTRFGDDNTGIFFPAADTIAFAEGGAEVARFDSAGNFGIGTTTLGYKLNVAASSNHVGLYDTDVSGLVHTISGDGNGSLRITADASNVGTLSSNLILAVDGTDRATIDSSGNLGLGVTPSAWGGGVFRVLQLGGGGGNLSAVAGVDSQIQLISNSYYDGAVYRRVIAQASTRYVQNAGSHTWETAPSGTAGAAITFTQAMTLSSGGALEVAPTTDATAVNGNLGSNGQLLLRQLGGSAANNSIEVHIRPNAGKSGYVTFTESAIADRWSIGIQNGNDNLRFMAGIGNGGTERMALTSAGILKCAGVYNNTVGATNRDVFVDNTGVIGYVASIRASKTNIQDLTDTSWLHQLNPVTFNYRKKDEEGNHTNETDGDIQYGMIAEDVEQVRPDLCFYDEVDGEQELRGIQYSKLVPVMLKEIQKLRAELNALKGNA
jgi:hypothetical protein